MDNLAIKDSQYPIIHEFGTVLHSENNHFLIDSYQGRFKAKKAASCLLHPEKGNKVLFAADADGDCYILSVLETEPRDITRIVFDGDVELLSKNGKIELASQDGIGLTTAGTVDVVSSELKVTANQGEIFISRLTFIGSFLQSQINKIKLVAEKLEYLADSYQLKVNKSFRTVKEIDHLKAGKVDYNAEKYISLRGEYTIVTAKEDVRINGERIHMG